MKAYTTALLLILSLCLLLAACSTPEPAPAVPTVTPSPSVTATAPFTPTQTNTPQPTHTSTPEATATLIPSSPSPTFARSSLPPLPVGEPAASWKDLPIMPGAVTGSGDDRGYTFTTQASPDEVQTFYEREFAALGWQTLAAGSGQNNSRLIIFVKDAATASLTLYVDPEENITVVLLVK